MSLCLSVAGASQQHHAFACWGLLGQLVKCQAFSLAGVDSLAGLFRKSQSTDSEIFRDLQQPDIISHGADDCHYLVGLFAAILGYARKTDRVTVQSTLVESLVNDGVEGAIGPAGQERV
jgi:hypothetical protein